MTTFRVLLGTTTRRIRMDGAAIDRICSIESLSLSELGGKVDWSFKDTADLLWAMLVDRDGMNTPGDVAEALPVIGTKELIEVCRVVADALVAANMESNRGDRKRLRRFNGGSRMSQKLFGRVRLRPF